MFVVSVCRRFASSVCERCPPKGTELKAGSSLSFCSGEKLAKSYCWDFARALSLENCLTVAVCGAVLLSLLRCCPAGPLQCPVPSHAWMNQDMLLIGGNLLKDMKLR